MLGLILCGGQSTRMGSDKGLIKQEARTWAQTAMDKLSTLKIPIKLSVNHQQYEAYQTIFPPAQLIPDNDALEVKGPLLGVLSCYNNNPGVDLFILACDMPLMEPIMLNNLHERYLQQSSGNAFVYTNNGEPEPLCGIYRAAGLASINNLQENRQLTKFSMKFMLDHLDVISIPLSEDQKKYFRNFNAHAELNGL